MTFTDMTLGQKIWLIFGIYFLVGIVKAVLQLRSDFKIANKIADEIESGLAWAFPRWLSLTVIVLLDGFLWLPNLMARSFRKSNVELHEIKGEFVVEIAKLGSDMWGGRGPGFEDVIGRSKQEVIFKLERQLKNENPI